MDLEEKGKFEVNTDLLSLKYIRVICEGNVK